MNDLEHGLHGYIDGKIIEDDELAKFVLSIINHVSSSYRKIENET